MNPQIQALAKLVARAEFFQRRSRAWHACAARWRERATESKERSSKGRGPGMSKTIEAFGVYHNGIRHTLHDDEEHAELSALEAPTGSRVVHLIDADVLRRVLEALAKVQAVALRGTESQEVPLRELTSAIAAGWKALGET